MSFFFLLIFVSLRNVYENYLMQRIKTEGELLFSLSFTLTSLTEILTYGVQRLLHHIFVYTLIKTEKKLECTD